MNRFTYYIKKINRITSEEKLIIIRMAFLLMKARILVNNVPLKYYYSRFFRADVNHRVNLQPLKRELCLFNRIKKLVPFRTTCLMQNIALQDYLGRKDIHIPIYLGLKKGEMGDLLAHAWNPINAIEEGDFQKINYYGLR